MPSNLSLPPNGDVVTLVGATFAESTLRSSPPWLDPHPGACWHSLILLTRSGVYCQRCEFAQLRMDKLAASLKDFMHIQLATMNKGQNDVPLAGLHINT